MDRRLFLKNTSLASAVAMINPGSVVRINEEKPIRVGVVGCGRRGLAVLSSMSKHNINILAIADLFEDKLAPAEKVINNLNHQNKYPALIKSNMYSGPTAYQNLANHKELDAVLISSPAYTHPDFLEAAVSAGKHVYCEKPVAIDVEGCKRVERIGQTVKGRLSLAIGFQIRKATPYIEMIKRIHRGEIGQIINAQLYYLAEQIPLINLPNKSDDEIRIRNHFHFREISGGPLLDQGIHMLDVCNWALQSHPTSAVASGGVLPDKKFGNSWNHYQAIYKYPKDIHVSYHSTQFGNQSGDVCARFLGTKGIAEAHYSGGVFIQGENAWDSKVTREVSNVTAEQRAAGIFLSSLDDADPNKSKSFFDSIRSGNYINEAADGANSALTAILGRQAAEKGKPITWAEMYSGNEKISTGLNLSQFKYK